MVNLSSPEKLDGKIIFQDFNKRDLLAFSDNQFEIIY